MVSDDKAVFDGILRNFAFQRGFAREDDINEKIIADLRPLRMNEATS